MTEKKYEKELPRNKGSISVESSEAYPRSAFNRSPEEFSEEIAKGDAKNKLNEIAESGEKGLNERRNENART